MLRNKICYIIRTIHTTKRTNSPIRRLIHSAFGKHLLLTNTVSSGVLMFLGDLVQQELEYRQKKLPKRYDYDRLARMFLVGLASGPLNHYYYSYLNKILPCRDMFSIVRKILLDQIVMSPLCIVFFFYSIGLLEKKSVKECTDEVTSKFIEVYTVDWCVWPPTQFVNFYLVPNKFQVLYINTATMMYNVFLSYIKHREIAQEYAKKLIA